MLVVEDNAADAFLIADELAGDGIAVDVASTLADALARLGMREVEAVILDLSLPDAEQLEALEEVRLRFRGVPVIVRWPGVLGAGGVCHEPVTVADIYPTLLAATGLAGNAEHNAAVDGLNLLPLLRDPSVRLEREAIYHHYPHYYATTTPASAIRQRDWKLIQYFENGQLEVYNLQDDPGEAKNLAEEQPQRRDELLRALEAWRKSVNAPLPRANPDWKPM